MKYILDSGIFMNINFIPKLIGELYICQSIVDEIKSTNAKSIFELLLTKHKITILEPERKYDSIIKDVANKIGQTSLSQQDINLLCLALMLSEFDTVVIYSDDFGIRNISHELNIKSMGIKTKGGNELRKYKFKCKACLSTYYGKQDECEICGHEIFKKYQIR